MVFPISSVYWLLYLLYIVRFISGSVIPDQYQLNGAELWGDDRNPLGQSFTAGITGLMTKIQLPICSFGDTLLFHVHQGAGIHGRVLYTRMVAPTVDCNELWAGDQLPVINKTTMIALTPSIAVTAGSVYTFNFYCDLLHTNCISYMLGASAGNPYSRGAMYFLGEPLLEYDVSFVTYVQPGEISPTPPVLAQLDQYQLDGGGYYGIHDSPLGQSFTAGITGLMVKIQILVCSYRGTVRLHVYQGAGLYGPLLYTGVFIPTVACGYLTLDDEMTEITLEPGFAITAGSVYTFVCDCGSNGASCEDYAMGISTADAYPRGEIQADTGVTFDFDVVFATHVQPDAPNPSPSLSPIPSTSPSPSPSPSLRNVPSGSRSPKASSSWSRSPIPSKSPKSSISPFRSPIKSPKASTSISRSPGPSKSSKTSMSPSRSPSKSPKVSLSPPRSPSPSRSPKPSLSPSRSPSKSPKASPSLPRSPSPSKSSKASLSPYRSPSKSPKVSMSQSPRPSSDSTQLSSSPSPIIPNDLSTLHSDTAMLLARRGLLVDDSDIRASPFSKWSTTIIATISFSIASMGTAMILIHLNTQKLSTTEQDNMMHSDTLKAKPENSHPIACDTEADEEDTH